MIFLDLFSGIGGFSYGAYLAGMRFDEHYYSEIDKYCIDLYSKRFPFSIGLGDIRKIDAESLPQGTWIITGGFPCQPFSVAGKQKGIEDERNLWPEMLRVIRLCKPVWVVAENVPGVAPYIKEVVKPDLENEGYEVWPFSISAATMGAPHKRERIWILAYSQGKRTVRESKNIRRSHGGQRSTLQRKLECTGDVANTESKRGIKPQKGNGRKIITRRSQDVSNTMSMGFQNRNARENRQGAHIEPAGENRRQTGTPWAIEPNVGRLAHGVSGRVDRLKALGNSIVPQIAELLFRQIKDLM